LRLAIEGGREDGSCASREVASAAKPVPAATVPACKKRRLENMKTSTFVEQP
jgi:hypothetical protein